MPKRRILLLILATALLTILPALIYAIADAPPWANPRRTSVSRAMKAKPST